ncbi:MAG: PilN domain-containing protein [Nitrospiraceae bacterium]|nr:PilN domain-containing protein [Nitrospiraceae bacterium]
MIKINLLPTKRKPPRKVTEFQKQAIIAVAVLGGVGGALAFYYVNLNSRIAERQQQLAAAQAQVLKQENMLKAVQNVEEERKKVLEKIGVIDQLKKNQQGPVRMLDEISKALPNGVDLVSLTEKEGNVELTGDSFSNEEIVRFVENLKASPFLGDVSLLESKQSVVEGTEIYRYKLQFKYKGV